jgi:hypothetical protein
MSNTNSNANSFSKLNGTSIFVKTFADSNNTSTSFMPFVPVVSSSDNVECVCSYDTTFTGNVTVNGTFTNPSDIQLKENIQNIPIVESEKIMDISPVTYERENNKHYGFIAQDMEYIFPELVIQNNSLNCKTINYLELIPLMISKMQNMQSQIDLLIKKNK